MSSAGIEGRLRSRYVPPPREAPGTGTRSRLQRPESLHDQPEVLHVTRQALDGRDAGFGVGRRRGRDLYPQQAHLRLPAMFDPSGDIQRNANCINP